MTRWFGCMFVLLSSLAARADDLNWDFEDPAAYTYPSWGVGAGWYVYGGFLQNIHPISHENLMGSIDTPSFRFVGFGTGASGQRTDGEFEFGHGASEVSTVISIDDCDCTGGDSTQIELIRLDAASQIIETLFTQDDPPGPISKVLTTAAYPDLVPDGIYTVRFSTIDFDNPSAYLYVSNLRITNAVLDVVNPGDYNEDGHVNAADYAVWRHHLGTSFDLRGNGDESGASAGVVDMADYQLWTSNFQGTNNQGPTVWSGLTRSFTKLPYADPNDPLNQDAITENVRLARRNDSGLYNAVTEFAHDTGISPDDTLWATSFTSPGETIEATNWNHLTFTDWRTAYGGPSVLANSITGMDAVVYLQTDDIYLDLKFTQWSISSSGGGFSYLRSEPPGGSGGVRLGDSSSVPEPSALVLAVFAAVVGITENRQRRS